jgi:CRP-like cAMP-binding protein
MTANNSLHWRSFFKALNSAQLDAISLAAEEVTYEEGALVFAENAPATMLCILLEGEVDLFCVTEGEDSKLRELVVGSINPDEAFGLSALIGPHIYRAAARAATRSRVLTIDAVKLRALCAADVQLAYQLALRVAETAMDRMYSTQVMLAAEAI